MALYHSAKGSVNYTVVGSPTIVDGVVSGFAGGSDLQGNYLKAQSLPNFTGDVEIVIKFKADAWAYGELSSWIISGYSCFISIDGNGKPACFFSRTGTVSTSLSIDASEHSFAFTAGQDCYLQVRKTAAGTLIMYSSSDGKTYTQFATKTNTNYGTSTVSSYFRIGVSARYNPGSPFNGSIDLNQTYIKVNGQSWFGVCPVEVKKHQLMGPVGYTKVGSPTIVDGVASGFSSSDLLQISAPIEPQYITERVAKIKFNQSAIGSGRYHNVFYGPAAMSLVFYSANPSTGYCSVSCYLPGMSQSLFNGEIPESTITDWAWFKYTYDGTTASLYMSTDDENYTLLNSQTGTISGSVSHCNIGNRWNGDTAYFDGEIDLNETYIKVNDQLWFYQPADTKYIVKDDKLVWADPRIYIQEPGSGSGIDENTVALYHFNGTLKEEVSGATPPILQSNPVYDTGRFGQSVASDGSGDTGTALIINTSDIGTVSVSTSYTIDFWMYVPDSATLPQGIRFQNDSNWAYGIGMISLSSYTVAAFASGGVVMQMPFPSGFTERNTWHHLAYVYDKSASKGYGFIDGQKVAETSLQSPISTILYAAPRISYGCKIDEFRMSNVARWTSDFTLPTEPYGASTPGSKNYATQNIAPVPSGYTYGTTTTPSIGYVDMRTQQFTTAPQGATIGRDE